MPAVALPVSSEEVDSEFTSSARLSGVISVCIPPLSMRPAGDGEDGLSRCGNEGVARLPSHKH